MPLHCTMVDAGKQIGGAILYGSIGPHRTPPFLWTNQGAVRQDVEIAGR